MVMERRNKKWERKNRGRVKKSNLRAVDVADHRREFCGLDFACLLCMCAIERERERDDGVMMR